MLQIIIFAKQPLPGFAKTRLIPALGEEGAANLAGRLLEHALTQACQSGLGAPLLHYTPGTWAVENDLASFAQLRFSLQEAGDLGQRMASACADVIADNPETAVLLMGTDCPALTADVLRQMHRALADYDACLVPANDGGYVALAMRRFHPGVLADIAWSTPSVADATRQRMQQLSWRWCELPTLVDIDEPEDLAFLPDKLV